MVNGKHEGLDSMTKVNLKNILTVVRDIINRSSETAIRKAQSAEKQAGAAQATAKTAKTAADNAQTTANNAQRTAKNAQRTADNAEATANNAHTTADAALANFPVKYTDVVDTPFSAIGLPSEVTTYSRSSETEGTFINLILTTGIAELTGSGFYKISSDVFDFEDIFKIGYTRKYGSGNYSDLQSVDNLEQSTIFSSNPSVFVIDSNILFCGSTGTFEITVANVTSSFYVAETGIYSVTNLLQGSSSFINYLELTKKESVFIQSSKPVLIPSSTEGSTKKFKITVDDSGTPSVINTGDSVEVWSGATHSAYAAAQAGGYTDTEANFYADLAAMQGLASALAAI